MMASDFIIEVNEADFEYQVLTYSAQTPVVVDFWAEWCSPCRVLGPLLERLAEEGQGSFRLAKLNVDNNPNLALRYAVRSIPAVKAFRGGKMIAEFVGVQPEPRVREFIRSIAPSQNDLLIEKANSMLDLLRPLDAEKGFRQVLENAPESTPALLGLAKSLLLQGRGAESYPILAKFPASREFNTAEMLRPLAQALIDLDQGKVFVPEQTLDATFYNSVRLFKRDNPEAAMDGLLDILREDKRYRDGLARRTMVAILELYGESNPISRQYRNELALVLF
jgi:putative thioredoxin